MHNNPSVLLNHQHLQIMFHYLKAETFLEELFQKKPLVHSRGLDTELYRRIAVNHIPNSADTEVKHMGKHLLQQLNKNSNSCIFLFLAEQSAEMLTLYKQYPIYKYEYALAWRELSKNLGQDLLTTSFLAKHDLKQGIKRSDFCWTTAIPTDNLRLHQILQKGISENHFHLNGSVPVYFLSWIYLMNHPHLIHKFFKMPTFKKEFHQVLAPRESGSTGITHFTLEEKINYASFLRGKIFSYLLKMEYSSSASDELRKSLLPRCQLSVSEKINLQRNIETLRFQFGLPVPLQHGKKKVLDYAMTKSNGLKYQHHHNRVYTGERWLLYQMFSLIFKGVTNPHQENIFYLYLLLQNSFYSELIQVNGRRGFENFLYYQNRKDLMFDQSPMMNQEAQRIAIYGALQDQPIQSLEARISFKNTVSQQYKKVKELDECYRFVEKKGKTSSDRNLEDFKFFYVFHFIKIPMKDTPEKPPTLPFLRPRNDDVRKMIYQQARSLEKALNDKVFMRRRVLGIDACSEEIGCRPETFATEFRYLRSESDCYKRKFGVEEINCPSLRCTYHAGEDFLDLVDGLRAIDEAILFLDFHRGDRIGHALAMGIFPEDYYKIRNYAVVLPKQDLLDNLLWLLFRGRELQVKISHSLERELLDKIEPLFRELYFNCLDGTEFTPFSLELYYRSWKLRGDHPDYYFNRKETLRKASLSEKMVFNTYDKYKIMKNTKSLPNLDAYRDDKTLKSFCWNYHFSHKCRIEGQKEILWEVPGELPIFLEKVQEKLQWTMVQNGIGVECNPSSNVLISTFKEYQKHPVFRFNNFHIAHWNPEIKSYHMNVSLNTDDLGVFATSLENEYTLLACCLEREVRDAGLNNLTSEEIYSYLDYLRDLGNGQSFLNDVMKIKGSHL